MSTKLFYPLALLLSFISCFLTGYDVKKLMPFGKSAQEISNNIKLLAVQKVKVSDAINLHFEQQEQEIYKKIWATNKISAPLWTNKMQQFNNLVAQDQLFKPMAGSVKHSPQENSIIKKARELTAAFGMNPAALSIIDSAAIGTAGVVSQPLGGRIQHTLHLHIAELSMLSEQEYTAIIKHELMHLWYGDSLKLNVLAPFFSAPSNSSLLSDFRKNFEMRADIMATIHDTKDIAGLSSWCNKYSFIDQYPNVSHPTMSERIGALKQLSTYLSEEKKHTAAAA